MSETPKCERTGHLEVIMSNTVVAAAAGLSIRIGSMGHDASLGQWDCAKVNCGWEVASSEVN